MSSSDVHPEEESISNINPSVSNSSSTNNNPVKKPKKVRKPQSEEEYLRQKSQFHQHGPLINTDDWFYDEQALSALDVSKKTDRIRILHACEKAYYDRNYKKCLEFVATAESLFGVDLQQIEAVETTQKKGGKTERHILDLLYIRKKCLEKLT